MKSAIFAATVASTHGAFYTNHTDTLKVMWEDYKLEYKRTYHDEEDRTRFGIFVDNLKLIDQRNREETNTAIHGINKFSDISHEEFRERYLSARRPVNAEKRNVVTHIESSVGDDTFVDWTGVYTTPVKDQGYCGSCWAFSATEQIESDAMRELSSQYILSPEQITQCTTAAFGCGGGWTESAYAYVIREGGLATEDSYPYTSYMGTTGTCHADPFIDVVGITGFTTIDGESNMAAYVQSTGPLSVCVDANNWSSYTGGIMSVCGQSVDHCVQAVGVQTGTNGFWKVRNSWGTSWGESGFIQLAYGSNTCAIANDPTYTNGVFLD